MSQEDDSFNSTGATVVAFETLNTEGFAAFGVSVSSTNCGVYGRTLGGAGDPNHDGRTAPMNTGVFGRSDSHGVYGITSSISDVDTPDFTNIFGTAPFHGAGVVGVQNSNGPAILADNGIIGVDVRENEALAAICGVAAGVASISYGPAILGLNTGDVFTITNVHQIVNGSNSDIVTGEPNISQPGVLGISASGPGVRGVGVDERGGVFESRVFDVHPLAQVRLVPTKLPDQVFPIGQDPVPPTDEGETGDLLALTYRNANNELRAALFFCTGGVHTESSGSAVWARLA